MKDLPALFFGMTLGLILSLILHNNVARSCSLSGEIKSKTKIKPALVVTQSGEKIDTLFVYRKIEN